MGSKEKVGKNAHTPLEFLTTGQNTLNFYFGQYTP